MRYINIMRTTLSIDDDMLERARALADLQGRPLGSVVSDALRKAFAPRNESVRYRNGVPLLPVRDPNAVVTLDIVNRLREEIP